MNERRAPPAVEILLATYHGERFLPELLESLESQSFRDFRILVRDDGSRDRTPDLLRRWADAEPARRILLEDEDILLGPALNFGRLMEASGCPYVMFCDQDDVWRPQKIALTLEVMRSAEAEHGATTPLLVHTDLQVVDADLEELDESFWRYQNLDPGLCGQLGRTVVHNAVTGCATMVNRPLLERALPVPPEAIMHDWWLALVAAAFGEIVAVPEPTIAYRQHGENDTGARRWSAGYLLQRSLRLADGSDLHHGLQRARCQAAAFWARFARELEESDQEAIRTFLGLDHLPFWRRRRALIEHGLLKQGFLRNVGLLVRV